MPAVAVCSVDIISTGHGCDVTAGIQGNLQSKVTTIGGNFIAVEGDAIITHTLPLGDDCIPHTPVINAGSSKVFIMGIPVARIGDSADAGSIVTGSAKIFAGD